LWWTTGRVLLVAAAIAFGIAVHLGSRTVENPGVQECGSPVAFLVLDRDNVVVRPGDPDAPPDALALARQPTCRDLATVEAERAALAFGAFLTLGLLGIAFGLLDDRIAYRRAPRFETLLRPLPEDAPVRRAAYLRVPESAVVADLPPLERPEVLGFVGVSLATSAALVGVAGIDDVGAVARDVEAPGVLVAVLAIVVVHALAVAQRVLAYTGLTSPVDAARHVVATSFGARVRPLVGWAGLDLHRLVRAPASGSEPLTRQAAHRQVGALQLACLSAHGLGVVVVALAGFAAGAFDADVAPTARVVAAVTVVVLVLGAGMAFDRVRGMPVRPDASARDRLVALGAARAWSVVGVSSARLVADVVVLVAVVAACGGGAAVVGVAATSVLAVTLGAAGPLPDGLGVVDAALVVGLVAAGAPLATAVVAVVLWRLVTTWLPLIPGAVLARRLRSAGEW
jgi:hypothetical protein